MKIGVLMVRLIPKDIHSKEILNWKGLHLFHFSGSSCSQKIRIMLNLKCVEWTSHPIDLTRGENLEPWFMGINPRGLLPVLVMDGAVHIESNDIIEILEKKFVEPRLIPKGRMTEIRALLKAEDDLHFDIRSLTFRFLTPQSGVLRGPDILGKYNRSGSGLVQGKTDTAKQREIKYWRGISTGLSNAGVRQAVQKFAIEFTRFEQILTKDRFLFADQFSIIDIAWYIYASRLILLGYPLGQRHPKVFAWFNRLDKMPGLAAEVAQPATRMPQLIRYQQELQSTGTTLRDIIDV